MANKRISKDIGKLLEETFADPPGSELTKPLKEGASLQATVDGEVFSLLKRDGGLVVSKGSLDGADVSVELNREACEYMASSAELEEFIDRARECIRREHGTCYMDYQINASIPRMLLKGYLDFARTFGIV